MTVTVKTLLACFISAAGIMTAQEAVEYGLVDEIIHPAENAAGAKAG